METFKTLTDAIALAEFAHRNQLDKAGLPYIDHPRRVLAGVQAKGCRPYVQIAAILHDVTEDTAFSIQMLRDLGFSPAAVDLVRLVDKYTYFVPKEGGKTLNKDKTALGFIDLEAYYAGIRENPDAADIKEEDVGDNTQRWRLSYLPQQTQDRLLRKYDHTLTAIGRPRQVPGW